MGKRHSTFSGLSRFALEAFKQGEDQPHSHDSPKPSPHSPATNVETSLGSARTASERHADQDEAGPSKKKRKIGLLGPGYEKYDATSLVPYYTDASEVPDRLRKCACFASTIGYQLISFQTSSRGSDTFHCIRKAAYLTKKVGIASPPSS